MVMMVNIHLHAGMSVPGTNIHLLQTCSDTKKKLISSKILSSWHGNVILKTYFKKISEVSDLEAIPAEKRFIAFEKHVVFFGESKHVQVREAKSTFIDLSFSFRCWWSKSFDFH